MFEVDSDRATDVVLCANQSPSGPLGQRDFTINIVFGDKPFTATLYYKKSSGAAAPSLQAPAPVADAMVDLSASFDRTSCDKEFTFDLEEQIVNYLRPTIDLPDAKRMRIDQIPVDQRKSALLVN